jgi:hypothetical protein
MKEDLIYALARRVGAGTDVGTGEWGMTFEQLESFAYELINHEREACAKVCENLNGTSSRRCAEAIRERGEA